MPAADAVAVMMSDDVINDAEIFQYQLKRKRQLLVFIIRERDFRCKKTRAGILVKNCN